MSELNFDELMKSLQKEDSTEAPFGLNEESQSVSKLTFHKVRAKNFRSIGDDWMELNFETHQTTLVVSDDNGSGKSTLCVWAPYFAITGKPYSKREKIASLVNSQTRKDMLVELYCSTRGRSFKILRGYKPSVFKIYEQVSGSWVEMEAPASASDQQKQLETLLGVDSSILEKTMILGLDKFEPFVDLDASSRRALVERIWDLGVFSVMLDECKARLAILNRQFNQLNVEINSVELELKNAVENVERAEQLRGNLTFMEKEIESIKERLPQEKARLATMETEYNAQISKIREEIIQLKSNKDRIVSQVKDEFSVEGERLKAELEEANKKAEEMVETSSAESKRKVLEAQANLDEAKTKDEAELKTITDNYESKMSALDADLKNANETFKQRVGPILSEKFDSASYDQQIEEKTFLKETLISENGSYYSRKKEIEAEILNIHRETIKIKHDISEVMGSIMVGKSKLEEIEKNREKLRETGNCPHCLQLIGEEAIKMFDDSVSEKIAMINGLIEEKGVILDRLHKELADFESTAESLEAEDKSIDTAILSNSDNISTLSVKLATLQSELQNLNANFEAEKKAKAKNLYDEIVDGASKAISEAKNQFNNELNDYKTKSIEFLTPFSVALATAESEQRAVVAEAQKKASELLSDSRAAFSTWELTLNAEIKQRTSDLNSRLDYLEKSASEIQSTYNRDSTKLKTDISTLEADLSSKVSNVEDLTGKISSMFELNQSKVDECTGVLAGLSNEITNVENDIKIMEYMRNELGDSAAKREIIRQYIPFLNNKINEYMAAMNLFVGFKMDEAFDVEFTSPDRKNQTIYSLSNGQKTRMNISILFALRDIANLKNTTSTNLLVLDEILESISEQGIREVVEMLQHKFSDQNIIVISQRKKEFSEYFHNTITYGLRGGFTTTLADDWV